MPSYGSLFSGVGGLDRAVERFGFEPRWQVERDEFCQRILARHWPDVRRFDDVCSVGAELEPVDLVCGGWPCQPVSQAGRRLVQADARWLWPEVARLLRVVGPSVFIGENVAGHLVRGWGDVLGDLASLGFAAEWGVLTAAAVGAPHRRARVFLVAYRGDDGRELCRAALDYHGRHALGDEPDGCDAGVGDAERVRLERLRQERGSESESAHQGRLSESARGDSDVEHAADNGRERAGSAWRRWPGLEDAGGNGWPLAWPPGPGDRAAWERVLADDPSLAPALEPQVRRVPDGISTRLDLASGGHDEMTRAMLHRRKRLRALGNAVVSAQAEAAIALLLARVVESLDGGAA